MPKSIYFRAFCAFWGVDINKKKGAILADGSPRLQVISTKCVLFLSFQLRASCAWLVAAARLGLFKFQCLFEPRLFNFLIHIVRQVKILTINIFFADLYRQAIFQWILHNSFNSCNSLLKTSPELPSPGLAKVLTHTK